ncbi:hypothetical protein [Pedobacter frigoris]|uniref:DUF3352 domain-containing protein n=1 Tax=Pedobacter frigoris TaxID=2571272 RepID=A0A4U1CSX4_9SPHI|nr:hypothetical protein [Pedobacter frigoris]TKC09029.1 hypothetical protein FA047_02740 [Pedobacter frigoris]
MKKILAIIITLIAAIITMAYLYFSGLNSELKNNDSSLYAATTNSAFVFSFENDKSVLDILKAQDLFKEIAGDDKFSELESLKTYILSVPEINYAIDKQAVYISLIPGSDKNVDFLYSTQVKSGISIDQLRKVLKDHSIEIVNKENLISIRLPDSNIFYLGIKDNLLLLSSTTKPIINVLSSSINKSSKFVDYIKSNSRITKNSVAEVYINFELMPSLLKAVMPGKLTGELSVLDNQHAFANLTYNFSKEKILLTGTTTPNDDNSFLHLFAGLKAQKISITNILPENTANYSVFAIDNYTNWKKSLNEWFTVVKDDQSTSKIIKTFNEKYRINPDQIFPKYFKNQFITFQLNTAEKIGAIELSNGDKVTQLLLDLSTEYSQDIKVLKEDNLLYAYFGEPLKKFKRPFYCIIDNYMVFSNNASSIQSFLNSYKNNKLLINNQDYSTAIDQLANTANISYFIGLKNSSDIFLKNLYQPYYKQIKNENGLKNYTSFIYQLSGDNGKFQTNVLINKKIKLSPDSNSLQTDSIISIP